MDKLTCMEAFVNVIETGNFSSAGRKLGISKTLVSKYVGQLEENLGVLLLHRTTRRVNPTPIGLSYYQRCLPLLEEVREIEGMVRRTHIEPTGNLLISAPVSVSELHLMPVVSEFIEQYPEVTLDLQLNDRFVDIVEEGIDIAIRIGKLENSSLIARKIASIRLVTYASSTYLEHAGVPIHPHDLVHHRCIIDTNFKGGGNWPFEEKGKSFIVQVKAPVKVNNLRVVRELILAGAGISRSPIFAISDDVREGRIKLILESFESPRVGFYALYSHRRHLSAKIRIFIDFLVKHFGENRPWEVTGNHAIPSVDQTLK